MVKLYNDGKRITAALSGDIDHHAAREMRRELDEVIERSQPELLIIDMENVGFMDSSGIGLILGRLRAVRACGGDIIIKNARPEIAGVIKLSCFSAVIPVRGWNQWVKWVAPFSTAQSFIASATALATDRSSLAPF